MITIFFVTESTKQTNIIMSILNSDVLNNVTLIGEDPNGPSIPNVVIQTHAPTSYPSDCFKDKKKPTCKIPKWNQGDWEMVVTTAIKNFWTGQLTVETALAFMYGMIEKNPGTLTKDWESFNISIGKAGDNIDLKHIFNIVEEGELNGLATADSTVENEKRVTFIAIAAMLRLNPQLHEDYKGLLIDKINLVLATVMAGRNITTVVQNYGVWSQNTHFVTLMAGIDMFFQEFPTHSLAEARIGTIVTRFKDCSVLLGSKYILEKLNLTSQEMALLIFNRKIGLEYRNVMRADQELGDNRSYSMYYMSMNLAEKSAFSASANPSLHSFYHFIGSGLMSKRSQNARAVGDPDNGMAFKLGCLLSYIYSDKSEAAAAFGAKGIDENAGIGAKKALHDISTIKEPENRNILAWRRYIKQVGGRVPDHIIKSSCYRMTARGDCREGTIGKMAYDMSIAWLQTNEYPLN